MSPAASSAAISSLGEAELGQDFAAMLADQRGGPFDRSPASRSSSQPARRPAPAAARMIVAGDHAHMPDLRVFRRAADVLDLGAPDVGGEQPREQVLPW